MHSENRPRIERRSVDSALVGRWQVGSSVVRIASDGWSYSTSENVPYEISANGQTLRYPSSGSVTEYGRFFGSGPSIIGVWRYRETIGSETWIEEIHFRDNGTYTFQWTLNGEFDSEGLGNYTDQLTAISSEERRAIIITSAPNLITFDPLYAPNESGRYSVAADGNSWTYLGPAGTLVYQKV